MITKSGVIATKGQLSEKCLGLDGADIIQKFCNSASGHICSV